MSLLWFYMNNFLEFVASGTILYFGVAALAGVVAYVLIKWPAAWNLVMWLPRMVWRPLWAWVKGLKPVAKVTAWVTATSWWKWLEAKQYDPPAHPLSWWAPRALVVLWFVVVGMSMAYWHGRNSATPDKAMRIAWAWKNRSDLCQQDLLKERALNIPAPAPKCEAAPPPPPKGKGKKAASQMIPGLF